LQRIVLQFGDGERERENYAIPFGLQSLAPALFDVSISDFYERKPDLQMLLTIYYKQPTKTYHEAKWDPLAALPSSRFGSLES
jgi:hypothetical protein